MKKITLILISILFCMFISSSCQKEKSLEGTTWKRTTADDVTLILNFTSSQYAVYKITVGSTTTTASYIYSYNHPEVILDPEDSGNAILKGVINSPYSNQDNIMTVTNTSTGKSIGIFIKQP